MWRASARVNLDHKTTFPIAKWGFTKKQANRRMRRLIGVELYFEDRRKRNY